MRFLLCYSSVLKLVEFVMEQWVELYIVNKYFGAIRLLFIKFSTVIQSVM